MPTMTGKHALAQMLIAEGVEYIFGNPGTSESPLLDLAAIARGMGVAGEKVEDPAALGPALSKAYASGKPAVIDVSIDGAL